MLKATRTITIILFLVIPALTKAQSGVLPIARQINALQQYAAERPVEKVHLQLDRDWYGLGDTIWFKAYTVTGDHHTLSGLSGVLYAELIGINNNVLQRLTIRLNAGTGAGDFTIPPGYVAGNYRIRAYTNWMRNDSSAYFYNRVINIGGISSLLPINSKTDTTKRSIADNNPQQLPYAKPDVQFFPEGGQLVNGLRSKVAFKAVDHNGHSINIKGSIIDEANNEVALFETQHNGMGEFPLKPEAGKQYRAKIITADGNSFYVELPKAKEHGFTLTVNNTPDSIYITVAANDKLYKSGIDTAFYLLGTEGGQYYYTTGSKLSSPVYSIQIAVGRFPTGIARFTLFSQNGEPLCERVIFIQHKDLDLELKTNKDSYSKNENVEIQLNANDATNNAATGNFSVAVTNETEIPADEQAEHTIFTDLLLSEELKGNIENPNYYFTKDDDKTRNDLDLLMLTQGYRRFEWQKVMQNAAMQQIEGLVKDSKGLPVAGAKVSLISMADQLVKDTLTDKDGHFIFENTSIADSARLLLKARKKDKEDMVIYVLNPNKQYNDSSAYNYTDTARQMVVANNKQAVAVQPEGKVQLKGKVLQEVKVRSVKKEKPSPYNKYGTTSYYTISGERFRNYATPETGLLGTVPGLLKDGHGILGTWSHSHSGVVIPILVMVNKMRIDPKNVDEELNMDDVENVVVIPADDFGAKVTYGLFGYAGELIVINTKQKPTIGQGVIAVKDTVLNGRYFTTTGQPTGSMIYVFRMDSSFINDQATFIPEQALSLSGTITTMKNKPVADGKIQITSVKDFFSADTTTDDNGNFTFTGLELDDNTKVVINAKKASGGNNVHITIKPPVYAAVDKSIDNSAAMPDSVVAALKSAYLTGQQLTKKGIQLAEVKVKDTRNTYFDPLYSDNMKFSANLNGPGNADQVVLSDAIMRSGGGKLSEALVGKLDMVSWRNGMPYNVSGRNNHSIMQIGPKLMTVFLEGARISPGMIDDINPDDVYSIELLNSASHLALYGSEASGGALIITLKHGVQHPDNSKITVDGLVTYNFNGFYKTREFYSPKYDAAKPPKVPDERQTVYWNPAIITDSTGTTSFSYFNAGTPGNYRVVVEGIDANGNLGRQVFHYKVE